jgi:hypothetical protein
MAAATVAWKIGAPSSSPLRGSVFAITITSFLERFGVPRKGAAPGRYATKAVY